MLLDKLFIYSFIFYAQSNEYNKCTQNLSQMHNIIYLKILIFSAIKRPDAYCSVHRLVIVRQMLKNAFQVPLKRLVITGHE